MKILSYIELILALLLLLCIFDMLYSYYEMVRFLAMSVFAWKAYEFSRQRNDKMSFCFLLLAILFQPFAKIAIGKVLWNIIDVIVAIYLVVSYIKFMNNKGIK